jgi:Uma2 family endonuclease
MNVLVEPNVAREIVYPESDGEPMADNTRQFRWIVTIQGGLDALFRDDPNVFVAGDLLWYPVEGHPEIRTAPDIMTVHGRPKGDRGSYQQWREGHIAPQVAFEIWSPGNRPGKFANTLLFFQHYGVEEVYLYDPDNGDLEGWIRQGDHLVEIPVMTGWISPRLGIRFEIENGELVIYRPDNRRFATFMELHQQRDQALQAHEQAVQQVAAAEAEIARLRALLEQLQEPSGPAESGPASPPPQG